MDSKENVLDNSLESAMNMTQDEIEKLLSQTESLGYNENPDFLDADLESLLADMESGADSDVQDISKLLSKADNNEAVDDEVLALLKKQEEVGENAYDAMDLFSEEAPKKEGLLRKIINKFKKNKEQDKAEKEKKQELAEGGKKKKEKRANKHTPESGAEEEKKNKPEKKKKKENKKASKNTNVTEEPEILDELAEIKEKPSSKKDKKKKEKSVKEKKAKEKKVKDKKDTPEKIKEKPKEKPTIADAIEVLEEEQAEMPHKNKIIMICAACILIMLGFLVVNHYFTGHANKRLAEEAYEAQDYLECYQLLYGQKLNDSQAAMFHRSELILKTDIFWQNYGKLTKEKKWLEGLDKLAQFVHGYPTLKEYTLKWNCQDIAEEAYQKVETILTEDYETDVNTISAIADLKEDADYTRALLDITQKKEKKEAINQKYPDLLPEEENKVLD